MHSVKFSEFDVFYMVVISVRFDCISYSTMHTINSASNQPRQSCVRLAVHCKKVTENEN